MGQRSAAANSLEIDQPHTYTHKYNRTLRSVALGLYLHIQHIALRASVAVVHKGFILRC